MTTWERLIKDCCKACKEDFNRLVFSVTLEELQRPFEDEGERETDIYGMMESRGEPFTAWSEDYVYFSAHDYYGNGYVGRVQRNPKLKGE